MVNHKNERETGESLRTSCPHRLSVSPADFTTVFPSQKPTSFHLAAIGCLCLIDVLPRSELSGHGGVASGH